MNEAVKDAFSSPMLLNLRRSPGQNDNFLPLNGHTPNAAAIFIATA
jgi:hypothetical protein